MSAPYRINATEIDRLSAAMKEYAGDIEDAVNDVLHNQAGKLIQDQIYLLMPVSDVKPWNGKLPHAKDSKSLRNVPDHLSITVTTKKDYHYLYFPDDGSNTRNHYENQQFFARGGDAATDDVVDRCIAKLINNFENEV